MKNWIVLTSLEDIFNLEDSCPIHIPMDAIIAMRVLSGYSGRDSERKEYTKITSFGGLSFMVAETPEEIITLLNSEEK